MEYLNTGSHLGTGSTTVLSASTTTKYLVKTIHATNVFSADTSFNVSWVDNSGSQTYYLGYNITIPQSSSFQALDGTFTLDNLDSIQASCGNNNAIDLSISYMEINNSEG
jgi:hypothetical protein|tara:strand:+ start:239 stop:568 length:330 start_codon:yes stop_codon:yes gene_type:complete